MVSQTGPRARARAWLLSGALLLAAPPALAGDPPKHAPPRDEQPYVHKGFVYRSTTAVRYNPLGLSTFFRVGYQRPLLGPQENILLQRTNIGLHVVTTITPAFLRGGLRLDVQPLAFLQFLFAYEGMALFGTFDTLQSFRRVSEDFGDDRQVERGAQGLAYRTTGGIFTADTILQAKVGPILLVSDTQFIHTDFTIRPGDRFYFDLPLSMLAKDDGWMVTNETDLLYVTSFGLMAGARHGVYHTFFPAEAVAGEEARASAITPIEFAGPLLGWQFHEHNGPKRFNAPGLFLNVSFWIRNPYRTGQEVAATVPYIVSGFTFKGTL
ncbi:hypothetical protein [Polyangium spumosum]|uniref:Transporter n=1 Tax=Polyangium spumosum TaxID=889282 RepID=A0A6N7PZ73_9BACT|nr:hypothetical protein [Polyangium spumosum]MRG95780.1 hypothetical protein [Polyangium spumosum]